ncbi:DUF5667 domain-containing protein [Chloroflexota bacterium]
MILKKYRITALCFLIIASLVFNGNAYAYDEKLPDPGITPDSPFYFVDNWGKKIEMLFTFGAEAKALKAIEYAEERLAEARIMAIKNRAEGIKQATGGYREYVAIVNEKSDEAIQQGISGDITEIVATATSKHLSILDTVKDTAPVEAKASIAQAQAASLNGQQNALRALAREKPQKALQISLANIEDRLYRVKAKAEENNTEALSDAVQDTEKLLAFVEELTTIAQGLGLDDSATEKLVSGATAVHLKILSEVYEQANEQAKMTVTNVLTQSEKKRDKVSESPEKKDNPTTDRVKYAELQKIPQKSEKAGVKIWPEVPKQETSKNNVIKENEQRDKFEEEIHKLEMELEQLERLKKEKRLWLEKEIEAMKVELRKLEQTKSEKEHWLETEIEKLELKIEESESTQKEKLHWLEAEIEKLEQQIADLEEEIELKKSTLNELLESETQDELAGELYLKIEGNIALGKPVILLVKFEEEPVAGASVQVNGADIGNTEENGTISFTIPEDAEVLEIEVKNEELKGLLRTVMITNEDEINKLEVEIDKLETEIEELAGLKNEKRHCLEKERENMEAEIESLGELKKEKRHWLQMEIEKLEIRMEGIENTKKEKIQRLETEIEDLELKIEALKNEIKRKKVNLAELSENGALR